MNPWLFQSPCDPYEGETEVSEHESDQSMDLTEWPGSRPVRVVPADVDPAAIRSLLDYATAVERNESAECWSGDDIASDVRDYARFLAALKAGDTLDRLLSEAERRGAEKGWNEGQTSLMRDFLKPLNEHGMRDVTPNPYRKADQ